MSRRFEGDDVTEAVLHRLERNPLFDGDLRTRDGVVEHEADCWAIFPVFDLDSVDEQGVAQEGELLGWEIRPLTDEEYDRRESHRGWAALRLDLIEAERRREERNGMLLAAAVAGVFTLCVLGAIYGYIELIASLNRQ